MNFMVFTFFKNQQEQDEKKFLSSVIEKRKTVKIEMLNARRMSKSTVDSQKNISNDIESQPLKQSHRESLMIKHITEL